MSFALPLRGLALLVLVLFALGVTGCDSHLVGTRDVYLEYRVASPSEASPAALRDDVLARLHGADLAADVEVDPAGRVEVSVDESSVEEVDDLLSWPGGLKVYPLDEHATIEPHRRDELTPRVVPAAEGSITYYEGPSPALVRAVRATPPEGGKRLVADSTGYVPRTRVVDDPPLADLRDDVTSAHADGPFLHLTLTPRGQRQLLDARADGAVAFVRDVAVVGIQPLDAVAGKAELSFLLGSSARAYARAETAARLLSTKTLPRLVRAKVTRKPPAYALAAAEVSLPILMSLAWLAFVRRFDRARPEPLWLVLLTFLLGGLAVLPASLVEWRAAEASDFANPQLMTFGGQLSALPVALLAFFVTVGLVEEGAKLLAAWGVARQRREFDEPVDGIVYASASALGFAAVENIRYVAAGRLAGSLVVTRAFMSSPAHFLFASIWGYALGQKLVDPRRRVWPFFLLSSLAHAGFDTLLSFPRLSVFAPLLNFALATAFVLMLRGALRHGPIGEASPRQDRGALDVFAMGSGLAFALSALALHASAALVFVLGVYVEQAHVRPGAAFMIGSTALLGLVGLSAYGVSLALPLDVVLDDHGATFGGAFLPWSDVVRVERHRGRSGGAGQSIVLVGRTARLVLGPAPRARADALFSRVHARMSGAAPS